MPRASLSLAVTLACACGCAGVESESLRTHGMRAFFHATKSGDGRVLVRVHARDGSSMFSDQVRFSDGDELVAEAGGKTVRLGPGTGGFGGREGVLETDAASVTVSLRRSTGPDAPGTVIRFPDSFTLGDVPAEVSRTQALTLSWGPRSGDPMHVEAEGRCIRDVLENLPADTGSLELRLEAVSEERADESCEVELVIRRSRSGTVDESFGEGSVAFGHEARHASFLSTP